MYVGLEDADYLINDLAQAFKKQKICRNQILPCAESFFPFI
ncbi:MAG: hypothetical protein ACR2FN_06715 [Chitinophagaceae bacterium]